MKLSGTNWDVSTIAGRPGSPGYADGTNTDAQFNRPTGIALDSAGNIFVSERYNHTIREIRPIGSNWVVSTIAGLATVTGHDDGTNTDARFYLPSGLAIDNSNQLYVADAANFTIRQIVQSGTNWVVSTIAGSVTNAGFSDGSNLDTLFDYPYGVAVDAAGKVYVADWGNDAIREIYRSGNDWFVQTIAGFTGFYGTNDGPGNLASFYSPAGITVDRTGNLYVTDQFNNTIRKLAPGQTDWNVTTLAGLALKPGSSDGLGAQALFKRPWGIAVDGAGQIFVTDWGNSTIRGALAPMSSVPVLKIALSRNEAVLVWAGSATNYVLETTSTLGLDASWVPLTNGVVTVGDTMVLTNRLNMFGAFYRLRK
jgi:sugar lactone lactonase YvrE